MLLYALTILISAFLLFQVEPVIAKIILPWFGGSAAVWATCLLFFQLVLLLGYLYAHWLTKTFKPRVQTIVHIGLLAVSLATLPILPGAGWKPSGSEDPALRILLLLTATVGLPYFLLSTTGPLVQAWYARRYAGAMPYRLYALSNAGSMFALLSYPFLVEPVLATRQQALWWTAGYVAFAGLCAVAAYSVRHFTGKQAAAIADDDAAPGWKTHFLWMALPACASILLLAITNHLSQNVAAIPFLWILPLSLYLLTFILCFEAQAWYRRNPYLQLFAVAIGGMAYAISEDFENTSVKVLIPLFAAGLFVCCMVCHGELVRLKPHPRYLTQFYLMISAGGAIGGIFVALIAPRIFQGYYELPVGLAVTAITILLLLREKSVIWAGAALVTAGLLVYLGVGIRRATQGQRLVARNFYGQLRVADAEDSDWNYTTRRLTHGTINHGEQFTDASKRDRPTTYYGPKSGVGIAVREAQEHGAIRVGVIGLGTGTLATYGRPGDYYHFYEINPLVLEIANSQFTYLHDCRARHDVALGDGRLSLEREQPQNFDVLAVDAFSSDSIPIHLLTREAFELYFRQLKPSGVLAVHVSNKYLNLQPVVEKLASSLGKSAMVVDTEDDASEDIFGSTWALVTGRADFFQQPVVKPAVAKLESRPGLRIWTDDYSNLFQILK